MNEDKVAKELEGIKDAIQVLVMVFIGFVFIFAATSCINRISEDKNADRISLNYFKNK